MSPSVELWQVALKAESWRSWSCYKWQEGLLIPSFNISLKKPLWFSYVGVSGFLGYARAYVWIEMRRLEIFALKNSFELTQATRFLSTWTVGC